MHLTPFEQSGFVLETQSGFRLAIDIGSYTPVEKLPDVRADAMLVSHLHKDHFCIEHIAELAPKQLYLNQECIDLLGDTQLPSAIIPVKDGDRIMIADITVQYFTVDHGPNATVQPKENFGFLLEADGETVYFAGDMFYPSGIDVSALRVDVALIPVGTFYTFGPQEALDFVQQFEHVGCVVPMHYTKTPETRDEFVRLAEEAGVVAGLEPKG